MSPLSELSDPSAVRKAIDEYEALGSEEFLNKHGFSDAKYLVLEIDGKRYPSKAIAAVAYSYQFPDRQPLKEERAGYKGGHDTVARKLRELGFDVVDERTNELLSTGRSDSIQTQVEHAQHLVVKWTSSHASDTVERHKEIAESKGSVWWGVFSASDTRKMGVATLHSLQSQLDAQVPTFIWLVGPTGAPVWESRLEEIREVRPTDEGLIPSYYPDDIYQKVWLRISNFRRLDRDWLLKHLEPAANPGKLLSLGNQTNPLNVKRRTQARVWWVNQGNSYIRSRAGGYIWAPEKDKRGAELPHWNAMKYLKVGDVVLHYANTEIRAVGRVAVEATSSPRPDEKADQAWGNQGRIASIEYRDIDPRIGLTAIPEHWRLKEGGPFTSDGRVNQGYLFPVSDWFANNLDSKFSQLDIRSAVRLGGPVTSSVSEGSFDLESVRSAVVDRGLILSEGTIASLLAALESGKHVILTGPPGTAKTTLAEVVASVAQSAGRCDGYLLTTATGDWTTYETIGGLKPDRGGGLTFSPGHFLQAIEAGQWLIIDELNRSNFDRAFGQLFTVLSGQTVELPYERTEGRGRLILSPEGGSGGTAGDVISVPSNWRVIATMNVFDKSLLFEMSFALMRRFAFIEVPSPQDQVFHLLIDKAAEPDQVAADVAKRFLVLRHFKDLGPAIYMDVARYLRSRREIGVISEHELAFEAFYAFFLPQFEGMEMVLGESLNREVRRLVGSELGERLRLTLNSVLGLEIPSPLASTLEGELSEDVAQGE